MTHCTELMDLSLEPLDAIDAPLSTREGIALAIGAFGAGLMVGGLIAIT